jgi:hypothetical protein
MPNITIIKAELKDIVQLQKIGRQTFSETFSGDNTQENMANYLEEAFSIEKLTDEFNNKNAEFYPRLRIRENKRILKFFGIVPKSRKPVTSFLGECYF